MSNTTNCKNEPCQALVYVTDVPSTKSGFCWRCEVKRLRGELKEARDATAIVQGHLRVWQEECATLRVELEQARQDLASLTSEQNLL